MGHFYDFPYISTTYTVNTEHVRVQEKVQKCQVSCPWSLLSPLRVPTQAQELWKLCSQPESFLAPHHTHPEACHEVREIFSSQKAYTALPEIHFTVA